MKLDSVFVLLFTLFAAVHALYFEIKAVDLSKPPVCVRDFVAEGQLVVVNIHSSGNSGDGQQLDFFIRDSVGNEYRKKKDFFGDVRVAFTAHSSAHFDVCFHNILQRTGHELSRDVEVDIESGSAARDWNAIQAAEKLKPVEVELRKIEELTQEIVTELDYLKTREEKLRDTNESTNRRVKNFSALIIISLITLGVWQIAYLRSYFKAKHII